MKKILLYTDTPKKGGAELQMFLLAKFLNKNKFTPIFACGNYKELDSICENFEKEGIKTIRMNVKSKHDIKNYFQIKKIIKEEGIDILHIHVWNPASGRYGFLAGRSTKTPIITTEHDPFKLPFVKDFFKKFSLKYVNKIIAISIANEKLLKNLYKPHAKKISVIHNGIDITWWQSQLLRFTEDDLNNIKTDVFCANEDSLIITTIAELHERKGINYLISAMPEVIEKFKNIKLVIIGDGGEKEHLKKLAEKLGISSNVTFLGKQSGIPFLLKSSNIFVLPSIREGFGLVNLEAMITPLPIIASKVGGIPDIIENNKTGILVEPKDTKGLSEALIKLISSKTLREKYSIAGFERATKTFTAKKMAEEYEKIYEKM
ncbi:MAG: glycosyltransferase family 4 protein [Candidatus Gracilibacteria bacterium]|jgi:glycosyltransferase involved in cell wall biosynthesis